MRGGPAASRPRRASIDQTACLIGVTVVLAIVLGGCGRGGPETAGPGPCGTEENPCADLGTDGAVRQDRHVVATVRRYGRCTPDPRETIPGPACLHRRYPVTRLTARPSAGHPLVVDVPRCGHLDAVLLRDGRPAERVVNEQIMDYGAIETSKLDRGSDADGVRFVAYSGPDARGFELRWN
jgi:hypothetical protein